MPQTAAIGSAAWASTTMDKARSYASPSTCQRAMRINSQNPCVVVASAILRRPRLIPSASSTLSRPMRSRQGEPVRRCVKASVNWMSVIRASGKPAAVVHPQRVRRRHRSAKLDPGARSHRRVRRDALRSRMRTHRFRSTTLGLISAVLIVVGINTIDRVPAVGALHAQNVEARPDRRAGAPPAAAAMPPSSPWPLRCGRRGRAPAQALEVVQAVPPKTHQRAQIDNFRHRNRG